MGNRLFRLLVCWSQYLLYQLSWAAITCSYGPFLVGKTADHINRAAPLRSALYTGCGTTRGIFISLLSRSLARLLPHVRRSRSLPQFYFLACSTILICRFLHFYHWTVGLSPSAMDGEGAVNVGDSGRRRRRRIRDSSAPSLPRDIIDASGRVRRENNTGRRQGNIVIIKSPIV